MLAAFARSSFFFFFNDTATTEIYTLSLHDALPISRPGVARAAPPRPGRGLALAPRPTRSEEHTSELRHGYISYAVFCLKKKNKNLDRTNTFYVNVKPPADWYHGTCFLRAMVRQLEK